MHDPRRPVHALAFHASYRCHHAGACCTSSWPIPVEADRLVRMRAAMATGALRVSTAAAGAEAFMPIDHPASSETPALLGVHRGECVFFDREHGRLCAVHRALGHEALPLACRQFPRVCVHDPRGTSVTLSHFCPTAASLLDGSASIAIVTDASAFPADAEYAGLDAARSLPPLLRPEVLMDWEAWWEIERRAVEVFSGDAPVPVGLSRLSSAVETIRTWRPTDGPLLARVAHGFEEAAARERPVQPIDQAWIATRRTAAIEAIPPELRAQAPVGPAPPRIIEPPRLSRFLAAHAFANWTVHLGGGLRSWVRSIEIACAVAVGTGSVRSADLILRHLVDPPTLGAVCARGEEHSLTKA